MIKQILTLRQSVGSLRRMGCLVGCLCIYVNMAWAQNPMPAYSDDAHALKYANDPAYKDRSDAIENWLYKQISQGNEIATRGVLTIPVVVHVMHLPSDNVPNDNTSNLTNARIQAGIDHLNDAFRNRGHYAGGPFFSDAMVMSEDLEIEFRLAGTDPNGNPTNGILRHPTDLSNLFRDDACASNPLVTQDECLKYLSFWDSKKYLNMWLVNDICTSVINSNCDIRGYAYLAAAHGQFYDGTVTEAAYFGSSPANSVVHIHEVGHYLNMFDTYFDPPGPATSCQNNNCLLDGDRICDTPPDSDPGAADCSISETANTCSTDTDDTSANNPFTRDVQDIYENFMDGGDLSCKNTFTAGQKTRIRTALVGVRNSLLTSPGLFIDSTNVAIIKLISPNEIYCGSTLTPSAVFRNAGNTSITNLEITQQLDGNDVQLTNWSGRLEPGDTLSLNLQNEALSVDAHRLSVKITDVNLKGKDKIANDDQVISEFISINTASSIESFPYCVDFESGKLPQDWISGDFDKIVGFDVTGYEKCTTNGSISFRYNTSGIYNGGFGLSAAPNGTRDAFISPKINLTDIISAKVSFDVAYKASHPGKDLALKVSVVTECNGELVPIFEKSEFDLETTSTSYNPDIIGWIPDDCDDWRQEILDLNAFTGNEIYLVFDVLLEGEYSQNLYLDNICIEVSNVCAIPTTIPNTPGTYIADASCTDEQGWTHYWKSARSEPVSATDLLLLSVKDLAQQNGILNPEEVKVVLTDQYGAGGHDLSQTAPYVANDKGWFIMGRYYETNPTQQPTDSILLRYYFDDTDIKDLKTAIAPSVLAGRDDLIAFSIDKGFEVNPQDGHRTVMPEMFQEYWHNPNPIAHTWSSNDFTGWYGATIKASELSSGGMGSGGDGRQFGAEYPQPMLEFTGTRENESILLNWTTAREIRTETFEIYKSTDRVTFEKMETQAAGSFYLIPQSYDTKDESPIEGSNYYFVKVMHENGESYMTDTIEIRYQTQFLVSVFPNPFSEYLDVTLDAEESAPSRFGIYNGAWQELVRNEWIHEFGLVHRVNIYNLPPGIYFYVVTFNGETYRGKLVMSP